MNFAARFAARVAVLPISAPLKKAIPRLSVRTVLPWSRNIRLYGALCNSYCRCIIPEIAGPSKLCSCGCGIHGIHTRGDRELVEFLQEEIEAEKKNQKTGRVPSQLNDFSVQLDEAEIILERKFNDEVITVTLNVNHTVDTEAPAELSGTGGQDDVGDLKSKPTFEVDIKIGSKVMSFTCTYTHPEDTESQDQPSEDVFGISEVTIYEGKWSEKTYCVSGDILDGVLYDLLMNLLEERGINNEFADKLSNLSTDYEHSLYIKMLDDMQKIVRRK